MKKVILIVAFAIFGAAGLMAQDAEVKKCSKKGTAAKCCASKTAATATAATTIDADLTQVMSASMKRQGVTKRQCPDTGAVSYYKSETCSQSGKISYNEVEFDSNSKQFVNKSPNDIGNADGGKMYKVVNAEDASVKKAAGCSKTTTGKQCCSKKGKKAEGTK